MSGKRKRKEFPIDEAQIVDFEKLRENLNKLTKEELIDYIIDLFRENPDLIPEEIESTGEIDKYEKMELDDLIGRYREMTETYLYGQKIGTLMDKAAELSRKDNVSSIALFTAIFESIDDNYGEVDDSEGELADISFMCQEELSNLLPRSSLKAVERQKWQRRMFDRYIKNDYGIGDSVDFLLLETCKKEDLDFLKERVKKALEEFNEVPVWNGNFMKGQLSRFLAELQQLDGDPIEVTLNLYKEQELHCDYALELVKHSRIPEGIEYAKIHLTQGYDISRFAEHLMEKKLTGEAKDFLTGALKKINKDIPYYKTICKQLASVSGKKKD